MQVLERFAAPDDLQYKVIFELGDLLWWVGLGGCSGDFQFVVYLPVVETLHAYAGRFLFAASALPVSGE